MSAHSRGVFYTNITRTTDNPNRIVRATNSIGRKMRIVLQVHWHFLLESLLSGVWSGSGVRWHERWGWRALMLQEGPSPSLPEDQVLSFRWDFICSGEGNQWRSSSSPQPVQFADVPSLLWCRCSAEHWHQPPAEGSSALTEGMAGRGQVTLAPSRVVQSPISVPAPTVVTGEGEV